MRAKVMVGEGGSHAVIVLVNAFVVHLWEVRKGAKARGRLGEGGHGGK